MSVSDVAKLKEELAKLIALGKEMRTALLAREAHFEVNYQPWYTEAFAVVKQLLPDRLIEFEGYYRTDPRRKSVSAVNYTIQDWMTGMRAAEDHVGQKHFDDFASVAMRFNTQLEILRSAEVRFDSRLLEIRQLLQADIFDSELDAARELRKNGFLRAAGAVAGVVLEKHLAQVSANHNITVRKKDPTIGDLNDSLKNNGVIDIPTWRLIQRLGDLRNLCTHNKEREPTDLEAAELIDGVEKISKTLY